MSTLVQGRIGIALRLGGAVDGAQAVQLSASSRELLPQFSHLVPQPTLRGDQFGAALADDGARRAKRGSSNARRLKPNSRRSAGASTSTRSRESYATRSCASENFTAKSSPTSSARRSAGSIKKSVRSETHWRAISASFGATSERSTARSPRCARSIAGASAGRWSSYRTRSGA